MIESERSPAVRRAGRAMRTGRLAWSAGIVTLLVVVVGVGIALANPHLPPGASSWGFRGYGGAQALVLGTTGTVLAARKPRVTIGWLLVVAALLSAVAFTDGEYAAAALTRFPDWPAAHAALWVQTWSWVAPMSLSTMFLFLRFPTGRLPTPGWLWVERLMIASVLLVAAGEAVRPGPPMNLHVGTNPLGMTSGWAVVLTGASQPLLGAALVTSLASLLFRVRLATPVERVQLRWITFAGAVLVLSAVPDIARGVTPVLTASLAQAVTSLAAFTIPVAITVAVLRYRLYDIDRLISRTVSYALVTGLLVAVYISLVTVVTRLVPSSNAVAVAGSTLAVAALFQPVRRRVQAAVDRRFNRARYDAALTVEQFSARLRADVDLGSLAADLVRTVHSTFEPTQVALWLPAAKGERAAV
ncbi:MAG: hypothetical protein M3Z02_06515 [Actinomycetota bacterium]|nr:hypothetical protein [Actinomycetota bacterium]